MSAGDLLNRRAIVTGATTGIGRAITERLLERGCGVIANARNVENLAVLEKSVNTPKLATVAGDAAEDETLSALVDRCRAVLQGPPDLCVVNAGRGLPGTLMESDVDQWEAVNRINFLGAARQMRRFTAAMRSAPATDQKKCPGDLVVIGSSVGRETVPEIAFYNATKQALATLTESLRREMAPHGIRVTLIAPGLVTTDFQKNADYEDTIVQRLQRDQGPFLSPDEVAEAVLFVVSRPAHIHINELMIRPVRQSIP